MASYVAFFVAGILAGRNEWLVCLPARAGTVWLAIGALLAALPFVTGGMAGLGFAAGGARVPALAGALYESFLCTGLCVGLLVLFSERLSGTSAWLRSLAANAYAVYIVHLPIVVALQFAFANANLPALAASRR